MTFCVCDVLDSLLQYDPSKRRLDYSALSSLARLACLDSVPVGSISQVQSVSCIGKVSRSVTLTMSYLFARTKTLNRCVVHVQNHGFHGLPSIYKHMCIRTIYPSVQESCVLRASDMVPYVVRLSDVIHTRRLMNPIMVPSRWKQLRLFCGSHMLSWVEGMYGIVWKSEGCCCFFHTVNSLRPILKMPCMALDIICSPCLGYGEMTSDKTVCLCHVGLAHELRLERKGLNTEQQGCFFASLRLLVLLCTNHSARD